MTMTAQHPDRFLRACRRLPTDCTPVWLMRQAGRYMPEYRAIREQYGFIRMIKTPEVAAEITMQPIHAYDLDAAIIFSDLPPLLEGLGLNLTYEQGEGPVIHNPLRTADDIASMRNDDPREVMGYTLDAIRLVTQELNGKVPLIGFSGAPFTLASYAIEGRGSREWRNTKLLMFREPAAWKHLMERLADHVASYLIAQVQAGAQAVQIFDSWVGALAPADFAEYVLPYVQRAIATVKAQVDAPVIYFGTDTAGLFPLLRTTGADVLGVDWRIPLDTAWDVIGSEIAVQGNLDPMVLHAPWPEIERRAADILQRAGNRPGHIFNLGHGILTETPVDHVRQLVEYVHRASAR